jgi:hypothetical protein
MTAVQLTGVRNITSVRPAAVVAAGNDLSTSNRAMGASAANTLHPCNDNWDGRNVRRVVAITKNSADGETADACG